MPPYQYIVVNDDRDFWHKMSCVRRDFNHLRNAERGCSSMVIVWSLCLATANANADRKYLSAPSRRMKKMKQWYQIRNPALEGARKEIE